MAKQDDNLLDELGGDLDKFFDGGDESMTPAQGQTTIVDTPEGDDDVSDSIPGQLAVDVFETPDKLVIKARTAGVNKKDLDVSVTEGILTVSGTLSSGEETNVMEWHLQECYWGEFSRTLALPKPVDEESAEAVLKDGVLTISFEIIKDNKTKAILIK